MYVCTVCMYGANEQELPLRIIKNITQLHELMFSSISSI